MLILKRLKEALSRFRKWLEGNRSKNPKIFDFISKAVEATWILLTTFTPVLVQNKFVLVSLICVSFIVIYITQWALLKNETDRRCVELEEKNDSRIEAIRQQTLAAVSFTHSAAHKIRDNVAKIPHQEIKPTREALASFLKEGLNSLESILTKEYGIKISASVKLGDRKNKLKTYGRGTNNIESRKGSLRVSRLDKKSYAITSNYAYTAIFDRQSKCFADGNLTNLTMKEKDGDEFFWEHEEPWEDYFEATIVIPIRCQSFKEGDEDDVFEVLGLVCVDANEVIEEWTDNPDSYGYEMTAFFADSLYNYIAQYLQQQKAHSGPKSVKLHTTKSDLGDRHEKGKNT